MHRIVRLAKISCGRSKSNIMPMENFKFAENVAHFLILNRTDGGKRYVILPMMQPSRLKTSFKNVNWRPELVKENQLGVISKEKRAVYDSLPILNSEHISGPKYYFEDGLRKVKPYLATYRSVVKSRSFPGANMPLSKYLTTRFTNNSPMLLELEVKTGQIAVNLELVSSDYIVREGDVITRTGHLHETPILDRRLRIVHEDSNYLVVDKPSSWPVHSCGTFRFNSLIYILAREYGYMDLRPVHRIDRLTSGIVILAKSKVAAASAKKLLERSDVEKEYLALVRGRFPTTSLTHTSTLSSHNISHNVSAQTKNLVSTTEFKLVTYYPKSNTSLVYCRPITGRTHQIRLHLKELGFLIVNDLLYGDRPLHLKKISEQLELRRETFTKRKANAVENVLKNFNNNLSKNNEAQVNFAVSEKSIMERFSKFPTCVFCQDPSLIRADFELGSIQEEGYICLHSKRYKLGSQEFVAELPEWIDHSL